MSGGFDSFYTAWCLVRLFTKKQLEDYTFYTVDYPRPYRAVEKRALKKISKKLRIKIKEVKTDMLYDKSTLKNGGHIINMRNLVILALGAQLPHLTSILMNVVREDYSTWVEDKNPKFFNALTGVLVNNTPERAILGIASDKTKTQALKHIIEKEGGEYGQWVMENTVSCHGKDEQVPCGNCSSCLWKWVMMTNNGLDTERYFDEWNSDHKVLHKSRIKKILDRHLDSGDHWISQIQKEIDGTKAHDEDLALHIESWIDHTKSILLALTIGGYPTTHSKGWPFLREMW